MINTLFGLFVKNMRCRKRLKWLILRGMRFNNSHYSKALIHTFLAWKEPPGKPFGQAINANFFNEETELLTQFLNWLKLLFED